MKRLLACAFFFALAAQAQEDKDLGRLSLEQLMNVRIVSASNVGEKLSEAPATVIVLTAEDLRLRGYRDLTQIFDDLPGMDVIRPYGATYLKNYWRGYRNTIGDPFLIMIDGVVFNHLYFNTADVMATFPISNVERVEIVYGPASSVYGASAFRGVVNVITRRGSDRVSAGAGSNDARLLDGTWSSNGMQVTVRLDDGDVDRHAAESYEYTKRAYLGDPRLWGGFAGTSSSPRHNRAFDLRLFHGTLEAAVQYFVLNAGYGFEYAFDRSQNDAVWSRPDFSAYVRDARDFSPRLHGTTFVRYRSSGVSNDSDFTQSFPAAPQAVDFSLWRARDSSWMLSHDADFKVSEALSLRGGLRFERKHLQKAYDTNYGPAVPASIANPATYPFPDSPTGPSLQQLSTNDTGAYVQGWFRVAPAHRLNFGIRQDRDSRYGDATTIRGGYVGQFGHWSAKALYGQAFQEPNNRLLYGGWDGSGSDPTLRPERSTTMELSAQYASPLWSHQLSLYRTHDTDTFVNTVHAARNLGDRRVSGFDVESHALLPHGSSAWVSYSRYLHTSERKLDENGNDVGDGIIGDLARNKFHAGFSGRSGPWSGSVRARYIGARDTVETNPVGRVAAFTTADAFLRRDFRKVGLSIAVDNVTNRAYFHPGVRDANAGTTAGTFDAAGVWRGSGGYFNSLLPQPGRTFVAMLHFESP